MDAKGKKTKITSVKGWNEAVFSKTFNYYIHTVSDIQTPPVIRLYNAKHKVIRVLEDNHDLTEVVKNYNLSPKEFIQIPAADGETQLNAWIMNR